MGQAFGLFALMCMVRMPGCLLNPISVCWCYLFAVTVTFMFPGLLIYTLCLFYFGLLFSVNSINCYMSFIIRMAQRQSWMAAGSALTPCLGIIDGPHMEIHI